MATPLDQEVGARTGWVRLARLFSNIVSPPVMFAVLGLAFSLRARPPLPALLWAAVYGFLVSLLPILVVLYLLRSGRIAELHMSDTRERHLPYAAAATSAAAMVGLVALFDGPELLRCLALLNTAVLVGLGVVNVWWLISIHATAVTASFVLVGLVFGWGWSLLVLPVVVGVVWVRLYLRRHTPAQVLAGMALGAGATAVLAALGCFI